MISATRPTAPSDLLQQTWSRESFRIEAVGQTGMEYSRGRPLRAEIVLGWLASPEELRRGEFGDDEVLARCRVRKAVDADHRRRRRLAPRGPTRLRGHGCGH